jgi:DNA polymerase-3 subunit delta'
MQVSVDPLALVVGQPQAVALLRQAIARDRIAPAYLFAGPVGVGRSLAAQGFLEWLMCQGMPEAKWSQTWQRLQQRNHPDLLWVEPTYLHQGKRFTPAEAIAAGVKGKSPPQIRIDQVREIVQFLSRPPMEAKRSVVVLEDADTMNDAAANSLLKTLEEPGRATLILIVKGIDSVLPTLVSRCQRIPFYGLSSEAIAQVLQQVNRLDILAQPEVLALAQGSPGAAIAAFEQLQALPEELLQAVVEPPRSLRQALHLARQIAKELDKEAQFWLIDYLQHLYWQKTPDRTPLQHLEKARHFLLRNAQPRLVWEVTLMAMMERN